MKKSSISTNLIVTFGFSCAIGVGLLLLALRNSGPSPEESCKKYCTARDKIGQLVYQHPVEQTAGMRGRGPKHCECF
jgi:hypothetical protein